MSAGDPNPDHEWLNATPAGESRSITRDGVTYTVDRRPAPWLPAVSVPTFSLPEPDAQDRVRMLIDSQTELQTRHLFGWTGSLSTTTFTAC